MQPAKLPSSSKKSFEIIKDVIALGKVKIPDQFNGTGAPGDALEFFCNVKRNNYDSPDLNDWEVKFHGGGSLLTLLHKDPPVVGMLDSMVDTYGWLNKKGNISFRHTIRGKSKRGFVVDAQNNMVKVTHISNPKVFTHWTHDLIIGAIAAKLRRLILVQGKREDRFVTYKTATAWWGLKVTQIPDLIEQGIICIDFDARTKEGRGTALRNHGTKFRINLKNLPLLYSHSHFII